MMRAGRGRAAPRRTVRVDTRVPTVGPTAGRKVLNRVCHISTACERAYMRKGAEGTPKGLEVEKKRCA
eukprot:scaffold21068_cov66-Phaeocystis_antarctica.AAC.3